jgi:hypothetical protein
MLKMKEEGKSCTPTAVRLDSAAPDLAMAHLDSHKIAYSELEKHDPPIGEGTTHRPSPLRVFAFLPSLSVCVFVCVVCCVCVVCVVRPRRIRDGVQGHLQGRRGGD